MSVRDNQKSRVYAAERASKLERHKSEAMSIAECQAYVDKVLRSAYVMRKYPTRSGEPRRIHVEHGRGGGYATAGWNGSIISLGVWARQPVVILHELAHHIAGLSHSHDWKFAGVFLDLVRHFMGAEAGDTLKAEYKEARVRYRQPVKRPITPERRAALVEQLAAARAKKAAVTPPLPDHGSSSAPTGPSTASDPPS
jgi:putative metallohydrolase (TIGR04338 family)